VIVLLILKYFDVLRIDEQTEEKGIDYAIGTIILINGRWWTWILL
jgi:hypothetical protein